jgi:hypothetical protein
MRCIVAIELCPRFTVLAKTAAVECGRVALLCRWQYYCTTTVVVLLLMLLCYALAAALVAQ